MRPFHGAQLASLALALAGTVVLGPSEASAQVCVEASVGTELDACPANAPERGTGEIGGNAPRSRLVQAEVAREEPQDNITPDAGYRLSDDVRRNRQAVEARAYEFLEREVVILKRLVRRTRADNAQRPDYLLRLAETQFEMQTALKTKVRSFDEPIYQTCQVQQNQSACREQRQNQRQAEDQLQEIREGTIATYAILVRDHSDFPRMDEVLFALAFGLEELRQQERAREFYYRLIKGYPQSKFVPNAFLSFAEYYFNEEQDMAAALEFYERVLQFPPERNAVYGYALYKSAWAHYNNDDFRRSLEAFVRTIEFATQNPEATDAGNLARQARRELVLPYAMVGTPTQAYDFFKRYAVDEPQAQDMLESLAELYFDTGQWPQTIAVYRNLMAVAPEADKLCLWQTKVTNAIISSKPKPDQVTELRRLVDVYELYTNQQEHPAETVTQCKAETAQIMIGLATGWHREAIGDDENPGTNDRSTMALAARLYQLLVEKFPDIDDLEFPNIAEEDWPTAYSVAYYFAELLWKLEDWTRCGPAFDAVVELNPQGEFTSDAAYAAVLCYNNLYQQQYAEQERETREERQARERRERQNRRRRRRGEPEEEAPNPMAAREFTELENGMLRAFQRYVCFVPDSDDLAQIKYRRARIYYEANHFEEASRLFRDIAWNHRESELSEYAANLYLDTLNVLGTQREPKKPECITELKESIDPLTGFFCATDDDFDLHPDLCDTLQTLKCNALRLEAQTLGEADRHRDAAAAYVGIFRRHQECREEEDFDMDEVLYNAAIHFEAARLLGRAIQVRRVLIERFPESEWSKRAVYLVGANFHALAFYEQAASYYEQFARQFPGEDGSSCSEEDRSAGTCPIANEALQNAVFFRLGLGDLDRATADATLFSRSYKRSMPRETSQVVFSLGTYYEREEQWTNVLRHYRSFLRDYRRTALPNQIIRANVMMGRAWWAGEERDTAKSFFNTASRAWERAPQAIADMDDVEDAQKILWLKEALDATAEAYFYLAEFAYREFRFVRFPAYRGGRSLERIQRWSEREFKTWVEEKMAALQKAETEYNKIAALQVVVREGLPPLTSPPWQIAAASRIGQMYRSFVDDFRDAPIPEEIESDPELFDIYVGALDEQSEPLVRQAKSKFEFCLQTATNVRWFNEYSRTCERELNQRDPRQYPLADELRGEARYARGDVARPGPVELAADEEESDELTGTAAASESTPAEGEGEGE